MSLPKIPDINPDVSLTREDSINILIASVGLEEMALAHILNAEGEKIQYVLGTLDGATKPTDVTVCDVLNVNESVNKTLKNIVATEMLLLFKLEDAIGLGGSEECRKNLTIRKIWNDADNAHNTRPASVEITLLRDGEKIDTATLNAAGNWTHTFRCLPVGNGSKLHEYTIDETAPAGYLKSVKGYNITNTLDEITVSGLKTWNDNHNAANKRPATITINILQNGVFADSLELAAPPAGEDTAKFEFADIPFADDDGKPFVYTITENPVIGYTATVNGFNITNTLITGGFSFNKTSTATGLSLQGAVFEIRQNGSLISSSASDAAGKVSFFNLLPGAYKMAETVPPVGYMDNTDIYDVVVSDDGTVTIDGLPVTLFGIRNTPKPDEIILRRATSVVPDYMSAPNTWPLHGTIEPDLYMLDKILITLPRPAATVKWAYGIQDETYFRAGGGNDITATYTNGIFPWQNSDYTVYAMFSDGTDVVASITIDRLRDGTTEMPYLLIDFTTADALNPSVPGIDQFTLYYMQGDGVKLTQHYEIYENIDMEGKTWEPIGTIEPFELFTGSLYGNGNDITNLTVGDMDMPVGDYIGFFRFVGDGAKIQNLSITNSSVWKSYSSAGFIGYVWIDKGGSVLLKDLHFDGSVKSLAYCGGIVGTSGIMDGSLTIDGCTVNGSIESDDFAAGGIAAYCETNKIGCSLSLTNCYSSGSITGRTQVSGIIGILESYGSTDISNCVNAMKADSSEIAAGIVAFLSKSGTAVISSCYNKGDITGEICGGITGGNHVNTPLSYEIINCYNSGNINASSYGGGIYGYNYGPSTTQSCYNTGNVYSANAASGISMNYGTIENCAAVCQTVSGNSYVARISPSKSAETVLDNNIAFDNMQVLINGIQKSPLDTGSTGADGISVTATMIKAQTLYENVLGWDFTNVWSFGNGAYTLPILRGIPLNLQPNILPPHLA